MNKMELLSKILKSFGQKPEPQIAEIMDRLERGETRQHIAKAVGASETLVDLAVAVRRMNGDASDTLSPPAPSSRFGSRAKPKA